MKRDMDLVRKILLEIEARDDPDMVFNVQEHFPDYSLPVLMQHINILGQAGLVDVSDYSSGDQFYFQAEGLTWNGHEFLDAVRNDTVWNKVTKTVEEKGGSMPFAIMQDLALAAAKMYFGIEG